MTKITKHVLIPAIVTAIFFVVASLPVELLGCYIRGLIAAILAIAAGILGIVAAEKALIGKMRKDANSPFWVVSALILAIPVVFIVLNTT